MCLDVRSPKSVTALGLRLSVGLSLFFVGVAHYMRLESLVSMMEGLGPLTIVGQVWAFVLPGLMIVGGALLVIGMYLEVAAWAGGLALGSIPAGLMLMPVLSPVSIGDMMPSAVYAFVWLLAFWFAIKSASCCGCCTEQK